MTSKSKVVFATFIIIVFSIVFFCSTLNVRAEDGNAGNCLLEGVRESQATAQSVSWEFDPSTGTLTISGTGDMANYTSGGAPWYQYKNQITTAIISNGVTSIGDYAFSDCGSLEKIEIPTGVTSIGDYAFYGCGGLTSIEIPDGVTNIGCGAFWACNGIKEITMPVGAKHDSVFKDCTGITSVTLTGNGPMQNYNDFTYQDTPWYISKANNLTITIEDGVTIIGSYAFYDCSGLTSIEIPNGLVNIGSYAFYNCSGLESIEIPGSVTGIEYQAFRGCSGLNSIVVATDNAAFDSRNNCNAIIKTSSNQLVAGCKNTVIPDNVTSIKEYAFYNCNGLTEIKIPDGVTDIGNNAFYGCSELTEVLMGSSMVNIGGCAFSDCVKLKDVTMYHSMKSIGSGAFNGCSSLAKVYFYGTLDDKNNIYFFPNNDWLKNASWQIITCEHNNLEHHSAVAATFDKEGNKEYWQCTACKKYFTDSAGKNETTWKNLVVPRSDKPDVEKIFDDVEKTDWFADSVAFVYYRGIMKGMGGTKHFAPYEPLQREQLAVILYRLEKSPSVTYESKFYDVPSGTWYTDPIIWAYKAGVITGYESGYFGVGDCITREQFATMLYRYARDVKHITISDSADISGFLDSSQVSGWAYEAISWAVGNGIISGKDNRTRLDPQGNAARCEGAAMIERFMNKFGL